MEPLSVDLGALRAPAGLRDILVYERRAGVPIHRRFLVVLTAVVVFVAAIAVALWWLSRAEWSGASPIFSLFAIAYGILVPVGFVWFAIALTRRAKIASFAWSNGWGYSDLLEKTGRKGSAFTRVVRGMERAVVQCTDRRAPFELGTHQSIGRGEERATVQRPFAFIEIPLPTEVPHMVLKNRHRSIIPTLGLGRGAAHLDLEGHFASTFTLFVPEGYERDALYIFTPDVMERVLELGSGAEIELVGDSLFVYLPARTRFDRPDTMASAIVLAEELHRRFASSTRRYRDDDPLAARAGVDMGLRGRRLAGRGISVLAVATTVGVLVLSAAVTAAALFGGGLLRVLGLGG